MMAGLSAWARALKRDTLALYFATRDPQTPWYAKALAGIVVAYAFSPIDLIPDFIPVLGYLDDLILLPLGIWAATKLIPASIMETHRARAAEVSARPISTIAAVAIVAIWVAGAALLGWWAYVALR